MRCKGDLNQLPGLFPGAGSRGDVYLSALRPLVPQGVYSQPPEGEQVLLGLPGGGGGVMCILLRWEERGRKGWVFIIFNYD